MLSTLTSNFFLRILAPSYIVVQVFEHCFGKQREFHRVQYQQLETILSVDIFTYSVVDYGTFRIIIICFQPAMSNLLEVVAAHRRGMVFISEHRLWDHVCARVLFGTIFFSRAGRHCMNLWTANTNCSNKLWPTRIQICWLGG